MQLLEFTLDELHTSGITNKAIQKDGTGKCVLKKAILNYPNSFHLMFEVDSSHGQTTHFAPNGQTLAGMSHGYEVHLHFINISNIIPPDFMKLQYSQQEQILKQVFDKADVQIDCDCGAFYWQGMEEEDDKKNTAFYGFTGHPGTGEWMSRHNASGNKPGQQICKHQWAAIQELDNDIPDILKSLGASSSAAVGTVQSAEPEEDIEAQAAEQPAGIPLAPRQGVAKTNTINSEKAEDTVSADIEEIQSNAETQDEPTLETTETTTKATEGDTEAETGPNEAEPKIEEPTKAVQTDEEGEQTIAKDTLEDELEETPEVIKERFKEIYRHRLD
jgi:hypothetical protein